jgi:hypothetical protein
MSEMTKTRIIIKQPPIGSEVITATRWSEDVSAKLFVESTYNSRTAGIHCGSSPAMLTPIRILSIRSAERALIITNRNGST